MDKLNIANEMAQFDSKNQNFWDELTDEEKKKFSVWLMIRWGSSVQASGDVQAYYVMSTNERLNQNFYDIGRFPKLQWLCATTVSPGIGNFRHNWISPKKKEGSDSKVMKFLREIYPTAKEDDLDLLRRINTKDDLKQLAKQYGWDDRRIKADL